MKYKLSHIDSDGDEHFVIVEANDEFELADIIRSEPLGRWYPVHTTEEVK